MLPRNDIVNLQPTLNIVEEVAIVTIFVTDCGYWVTRHWHLNEQLENNSF